MTQTADPGAILQWKPIRPYPNYEVSNTGLVRNRFNKKLLAPCGKNGAMVKLGDSQGKSKECNVYNLVKAAFGHAPIVIEGVQVPAEKPRNEKPREEVRMVDPVPPAVADDSVIEATDFTDPPGPAAEEEGDFDGERWAKHPKYPDYEISTHGRVKALPRKRRKEAYYVTLQHRGDPEKAHVFAYFNTGPSMQESRRVDEVVLQTFVGAAPGPEYAPRHFDGVNANCALSNLVWEEGYAVTKTTKKYKGRQPVPDRRPKVTPVLVEDPPAVPIPAAPEPPRPTPDDDGVQVTITKTLAWQGMTVTVDPDGTFRLPGDTLSAEDLPKLEKILAAAKSS